MAKSNTNKKQNKQNNQSGRSTTNTPTKRNRRKMRSGVPTNAVVPLPAIFRTASDVTSLRLKTSLEMLNTGVGGCSRIVALTPNVIITTAYYGLGDLFPLLVGMGSQYSRFMVSRCVVQFFPTTATTSGGFAAIGYEPDDTTVSSPPSTLVNVASALHSDIAQAGEIASLTVNVSDYFNDWRQTTAGTLATVSQAGVVQIYAANTVASGASAGVFQIEVDIHLTGFRST